MESMKALETGRVIKSVGGYHTVAFPDGREAMLQARGKLKQMGGILAGDLVRVSFAGGYGVIEEGLPRRSQLVRPPVANVDLVFVVAALKNPDPSWDLVDRMLAVIRRERLDAALVLNKVDLLDAATSEAMARPYRAAGYPVICTSAISGVGLGEMQSLVSGRVAVLAGPSGAGKSSLINKLVPGAMQETGDVSAKTQRGRHTTRETRLLRVGSDGWIADTPGFSSLALLDLEPPEVRELYPEFAAFADACRFSGCLHREEPGCAVRAALENGELDRGRYERYLRLLDEVERAYARRY